MKNLKLSLRLMLLPDWRLVVRRPAFACTAMIVMITLLPFFIPELNKVHAATNPAAVAAEREAPVATAAALAEFLGVRFVEGSTSSVVVERDGREYVIDIASRSIRENDLKPTPVVAVDEQAQSAAATAQADQNLGTRIFQQNCVICHGQDGKGLRNTGTVDFTDPKVQSGLSDQAILNTIRNGKPGTKMPAWTGKLSDAEIRAAASLVRSFGSSQQTPGPTVYEPADDYVYSLPTGRKLQRHGFYVNFAHRFAYDPAFSGRNRGDVLFGLDGFSLSSFGFRFGVTDKVSVSVHRAPSAIGRPIEFGAGYNLLDEHDGKIVNAAVRVSVAGQDSFTQNFTTSFEGILSRTFFKKAQLYGVPTYTVGNRRLVSKPGQLEDPVPNLPSIDSFSLGIGGALDVRPTLAVIAEVIPTLMNGPELGIHRPAYAFGIQKRVRRHAFTLGFSNGPSTLVSQRAGTRATLVGDPSGDIPKTLFIGFDLSRQLF